VEAERPLRTGDEGLNIQGEAEDGRNTAEGSNGTNGQVDDTEDIRELHCVGCPSSNDVAIGVGGSQVDPGGSGRVRWRSRGYKNSRIPGSC